MENRKTVILHYIKRASLYGILGALLIASCGKGHLYSPEKMLLQPVIDSAQRLYEAGETDAAFRYLDSAFAAADNKTPRDWFYNYYFKYIASSREQQDPVNALVYVDSMLAVIHKNRLEEALGNDYMQALFAKGDVLFTTGQYTSAFEYYFRAKTIGQNRLTDCEISDYNYRLGMILFRQERYAEAVDYFKSCFWQNEDCEPSFGIFYRRQEVLDNTGLCYDRMGVADSALAYFQKALAFISFYRDSFPDKSRYFFETARGVVYGNMGQVYLKTGRYSEALPLLQQSIAINTKTAHDNRDAAFSALKLALLYRETGAPDKMLGALRTADTMLHLRPDAEARLDWHRQMAYYHEQQGQAAQALTHINRYVVLHDSLLEEHGKLGKTDVVQRVHILESQRQIASLQKKNDAKKFFLYLALVMMIMGLVIALLVYVNSRRSRRYIRSLTTLNLKVREQRNRLQHTLKQLEISHKEKDKILRVVAHDLRSPVAGISALTDLLLQDPALTPEQRDNLELIHLACEGSLTLSKEILEATGDFAPEKWELRTTDIAQLVNNHVELLRFRAREKQQEITLSVPEKPLQVLMNAEKISRVIDNVIINAIKFSPQDTRIDVRIEAEADSMLLSVRDQGIGIPPAIGGKVFDMFTEAKRYGTTGEKPYGLGLSISRQIVEAHGGKIWFESTPGEGTVFLIRLPYEAKVIHTAAHESGMEQSR